MKDYTNKNLNLNNENNYIEKNDYSEEFEIHLPSNTYNEKIPEINLNINNKPIINEQNSNLDKGISENIPIIEINKSDIKVEIPENEIEIKDSTVKLEMNGGNKDNNKINLNEEIIEGIIPGKSNNLIDINKNKSNNDDSNIKISIKKEEKDSANNISKSDKENNVELI